MLAKARGHTHGQTLEKMTKRSQGVVQIAEARPLIVRETATRDGIPMAEALQLWLQAYRPTLISDRRTLLDRYRIVDVARKVVGVGSVGLAAFVILLLGQDDNDPLVLQVKEAQPSVLHRWLKTAHYANDGERVALGQRLLQGAPDIFLGWGVLGQDRQFYVRQLRDMKGGVTLEPGSITATGARDYARLCGRALALAHARSGDAALIAGYLGKSEAFDEAATRFAVAYADQTECDHAALAVAVRAGRLKAVWGV